jgi:hypothetical protein
MTDANGRSGRGPSYTALPVGPESIRLIEFVHSASSRASEESIVPIECTVKVYQLTARAANDTNRTLADHDFGDQNLKSLVDWGTQASARCNRFEWGDWIAMSHCWGDRQATEVIFVNGESCEISRNMAAGLRAVSQLSAFKVGKLKLWNDFLCLDQQNREEIERELKRVPLIYANAFTVVAWVGPATTNSSLVMELLDTKLRNLDGNSTGAGQILKSIKPDEWRALASLLHRPYWRRQWMVQELTLASTRTMILCGTETAPLNRVWELVKAIIRNTALCHRLLAEALGTGDSYFDPVRHQIFSVMPRLLYLYDIDKYRRGKQLYGASTDRDFNILPLLDICRDSQQQYLRDKVYGILGLLPLSMVSLITPDLSKPPHEVYTDLVIASIHGLKSLDILQNCTFHAPDPVFPTWTPDLSADHMAHALVTRATTDAGGDLASLPQISQGRRMLTCRGFLLDEIDHMTPPQWPLNPVTPSEAKDALPQHRPPPRPHSTVHKALWQVLFGGSAGWPHERAPPLEYGQILDLPWPEHYDSMTSEAIASDLIAQNWCSLDEKQDLITFVTFRQRAGRDFDLAGHQLGSFFPACQSDRPKAAGNSSSTANESIEPLKWPDRAMLRQACFVLKRRRLFVTREGRLGICGRQARPGDVIVILRGCSAPLVLRRWRKESDLAAADDDHQSYVMVGACYVDGLTQFGEWRAQSEVQEQSVVLL